MGIRRNINPISWILYIYKNNGDATLHNFLDLKPLEIWNIIHISSGIPVRFAS